MNKINRAAPECSLYGFLASEAPIGVILRRGPSKFVQMIKWNTDDDTFELGQWFKGRVYEGRSDLSIDGSIFGYEARKFDGITMRDKGFGEWWSAMSRPPYFTALVVSGHASTLGPDKSTKGIIPDGWQFRGSKRNGWAINPADDFREKEIPSTSCSLIARNHSKFPWNYGDIRYSVRINSRELLLDDVHWIDIDQRGRLVFARAGKLFACDPRTNEMKGAIKLADFNDSKFEPIAAPEWAKRW
jgi:hypothetical protein